MFRHKSSRQLRLIFCHLKRLPGKIYRVLFYAIQAIIHHLIVIVTGIYPITLRGQGARSRPAMAHIDPKNQRLTEISVIGMYFVSYSPR